MKGTDLNPWKGVEDFKEAVWSWATKIGVAPARVQVQHMTRKWASCSSSGALTFSRELLEKDRLFGEAVIVHELLHLKIPNHGPMFRSLMRAHLPRGEEVLADKSASGRSMD